MSAVLTFCFLGMMILGAPIAFAMLIAGLAAVWMKPGMTSLVVIQNMFSGLDSFPLLAIPFFILAAELMSGGALTDVDALIRRCRLAQNGFDIEQGRAVITGAIFHQLSVLRVEHADGFKIAEEEHFPALHQLRQTFAGQ